MLEQLDGQVMAPEGTVPMEDSTVAVTTIENKDTKLDTIIKAAIDKVEGPEGSPETRTNSAGRPIGADGKFIKAEAKPSEASEPAKAEAKPAEAPTKPEGDKPAEQPLVPHARWTDAEKAIFATLPKEAQQWALNREKDAEGIVTRKTQELAEQRKAHEPLLNGVQKWSQYLQQIGLNPQDAWEQMLSAERTLRFGTPQQKQAALAHLAQTYGIPLTGDLPAEQPTDPRINQMAQEIASLRQARENDVRASQLNERQRAEFEFNALAQAKDDTGTVKFPHFERVKQSMIQLVADGLADTWDVAYSKSVRLDDDLYKQVVEEERQKALQDAEKKRLEAVDKANKAKPVVASNSLLNGKNQLKGIDAHISAALDRAGIQ